MSEANGPQAIWQLTAGFFMTARIVQTACTLGVFDRLGRQPTTADGLASALSADPVGLEALLTACTAVGVLERSNTGLYRNAAAAAAFLQEDAAGSLKSTVVDAGRLYADWVRLPEAVRGSSKDRRKAGADATQPYLDGVFGTSWPAAVEFAAAHDFGGVRAVLDVGGGTGAYAIALCQRWPSVRVTLLERASVVGAARRSVMSAGLADRIAICSGDYHSGQFDTAFDLVLLMNVLHQEGAGDARRLVERCARALAPDGRLAIQDICLNPHRTGPAMAALLGVNVFLQSGGSVHDVAEVRAWLEEPGLEILTLDQQPTTGATTIVARRPSHA